MRATQQGYSIHQAYAWLLENLKTENPEEFKKILNPDGLLLVDNFQPQEQKDIDILMRLFEDSGYVIGYCEQKVGVNVNQIQTQLKDNIVKGDKKWENQYVGVYDHPWGGNVVPGTRFSIKKEATDAARLIAASENRDIFVIMGKKASGFYRCSAQILYKPSADQAVGTFHFSW